MPLYNKSMSHDPHLTCGISHAPCNKWYITCTSYSDKTHTLHIITDISHAPLLISAISHTLHMSDIYIRCPICNKTAAPSTGSLTIVRITTDSLVPPLFPYSSCCRVPDPSAAILLRGDHRVPLENTALSWSESLLTDPPRQLQPSWWCCTPHWCQGSPMWKIVKIWRATWKTIFWLWLWPQGEQIKHVQTHASRKQNRNQNSLRTMSKGPEV